MKTKFVLLVVTVIYLFGCANTYAQTETLNFTTVSAAQSHPWSADQVGSLVHTHYFNSAIVQTWKLVDSLSATNAIFTVPAGQFYLELIIDRKGVSLSGLGGVLYSDDPSFDNAAVWQSAMALNVPIILDGFYASESTFQITRSGLTLLGIGPAHSGLVGLNPNQPVLMTRDPINTLTQSDLTLMDFAIQGVGSAAMVMTHMSVSKVDNISLLGFSGNDGFVFEYIWGNHIGLLKTNGANIKGVPFKWNLGVLDTVFGHLYSSNLVETNFNFNNQRQEFSQPQAGGDGVNTIVLMTAQGGDQACIKMHGLSRYKILNVYTENCQEILHVSGNVSDVHISGDFQGIRSSSVRAVLLDGNLSGITLSDVSLPNKLIEIGKINADIYFASPRVTGNGDIVSLLRRNANTPSSMPLSIDYQGSSMSRKLLKTNGWSWKFRSMYVDNNGQWQSDLITIPLL